MNIKQNRPFFLLVISNLFSLGFFILLASFPALAATITVSGIITDDETGNPISGATVQLTFFGSQVEVTTTDADGNYTIVTTKLADNNNYKILAWVTDYYYRSIPCT